jgi:hypothetical protein
MACGSSIVFQKNNTFGLWLQTFYCKILYYLINEEKLEKLEPFNSDSNKILSFLSIVSVKCGAMHSLALKSKGGVYAWGDNREGQKDEPSYDNQIRLF